VSNELIDEVLGFEVFEFVIVYFDFQIEVKIIFVFVVIFVVIFDVSFTLIMQVVDFNQYFIQILEYIKFFYCANYCKDWMIYL
jgi:hypothetical protein